MNARKFFNVRVSLTVTALALGGALVFSAMTTSCAGSGSGGSAGSSAGGAAGSGPAGGAAGGSTGSSNCAAAPGADGVNFCNGKAQGVMTGYAYTALGAQDTVTDPKCAVDPTKPTSTQAISNAVPCPTTGMTVWNSAGALCISGTIPAVTPSAAFPTGDYNADWGVQIGVNTVDPPATSAGAGTLGKTYATITPTTTGTVTPTNTAIRLVIHLVSMPVTANPYCATVAASGKAITLTSFNTACWDGTGTALTAADIPNIDKIGIQISSDLTNSYTVSNFCLTGFQFGN